MLGVPYSAQLVITRCTLYVPDGEVEWMRALLPPMARFVDHGTAGRGAWWWTAADLGRTLPHARVQVRNSRAPVLYVAPHVHL